jgi:hypothetical protein
MHSIFKNKKTFFFLNCKVLLIIIILLSNFTGISSAMTVPAVVYNGASFTPVCGAGINFFDVPNAYPPMNCGMSINFGNASNVTYEVRDLNDDGDPVSSAYVQAVLGSPGIGGCMNSSATNYNPLATYDDGSCILPQVNGCTDGSANNYNPSATHDDGSCTYNNNKPIKTPYTVYNGQSFIPVCGSGINYFDVPNAYPPMSCGMSINFGRANNVTYEIRGLDSNGDPVSPSSFTLAIYNGGLGNIVEEPRFRNIHSYLPEVNIFSPQTGSVFSGTLPIIYKATSKNDGGLGINPVSIFYSDKISDWYNQTISSDDKTLIAKDQSASSTYIWLAKDLTPGVLYRIIIDAIDISGKIGTNVSGFFTFDFTPPVFTVKTDPTIVRKGSVDIFIESSKDLANPPKVTVTQRGGTSVPVIVTGDKKEYKGTYNVLDGFDGTAQIKVNGTDSAGNIGTNIISGGTFSVGVNPPPKPVITSLQNNSVTTVGYADVSGTVREDTKVILNSNGIEIASTTPDKNGNFTFTKVALDKIKNHGVNYLSIFAEDNAGSLSESADIKIKYNIPPTITLLKPNENDFLSGQTAITVNGSDENLDILYYTYQIISSADFNNPQASNNWNTIGSNLPSSNFDWDTTEVDDGSYMLRAMASDGYSIATTTPIKINIKNTLPYFRFEDGRKTISKDSEVTINVHAYAPSLTPQPNLKEISYSIDNGDSWSKVIVDSTKNVIDQKFTINLSGLAEGDYIILLKATDTRDMMGRASHVVIVDKTAPPMPDITSINGKSDTLITDEDDQNLNKSGMQINLSGTAEANSVISLILDNTKYTTRTLPTGIFSFSEITLLNKGKQDIKITATDEAGNTSLQKTVSITYNNPPVIAFISPKSFRGISGTSTLSWKITDADGNPIQNVNVSYRRVGGIFKNILTNANPIGTYVWKANSLTEANDYELKISATDGITPVSSIVNFSVDRTPPEISSFTINIKPAGKNTFTGNGTAYDSISGIEFVEYSILSGSDNKRSDWYTGIITNGYLQKNAEFSITYPISLKDDSYTIFVRAVDASGNLSKELSQNIVIDRTPPRVGSFFILKNNLELIPDQNGNISFYKNYPFTFAVSMEKDTAQAELMFGDKKIELKKDIASGLWEGTVTDDINLSVDMLINATDQSGNSEKNIKIGSLSGVDEGNVEYTDENGGNQGILGSTIHILKLNNNTGQYNKFIPNINGTASIITTDKNGKYELVLPAGQYHLFATKIGYKTVEQDVSLDRTSIVNNLFATKKIMGIIGWMNSFLDIFRY